MPSDRQRSTRDRPAKAPLSERAIVEAALDLLRAEGPDAVSMRRVAQALDTGPASLYVYVPHREGLLEAMVAHVTASVRLEAPDPQRWESQLRSLLVRLHDALTAHPGLAALSTSAPLRADSVLALNESMLGLMLAGGVPPQAAAWGCDCGVLVVTTSAREHYTREGGEGGPSAAERVELLERTFSGLPDDLYPNLSANAARMASGDSRDRFDFALDLLMSGLVATVDSVGPGAP